MYARRTKVVQHRPDRQSLEADIHKFITRESAGSNCIVAVKSDSLDNVLDLLFVVRGDLFEGERAVMAFMRRLRDRFPDMLFDVMVLLLRDTRRTLSGVLRP